MKSIEKKLIRQTLRYKTTMNKIRKKVSYWKGLCRDLRAAVLKWRDVESTRNGFVLIEGEEANKWLKFYNFIDELIAKEYVNDPERGALHKELIKSELENLGKFNKNNNKRGIIKAKISTRILNYSLGLADSLGKAKYEAEASIRSLPSWSTLTRLANMILFLLNSHQSSICFNCSLTS